MMLSSILDTKQAVAHVLLNMDNAPVEIRKQDWDLMSKVVKVLKPFKDATLLLSKKDASISVVIPIVTLIIKTLATEDAKDDRGVLTMKRELVKNMERRFCDIESKFYYTAATLLDSKWKQFFFRDPSTFERTKEFIVQEMVADLRNAQPSTNSQVRSHEK